MHCHVWTAPIWQEVFGADATCRVRSCVRPVCCRTAVPLALMLSADLGPYHRIALALRRQLIGFSRSPARPGRITSLHLCQKLRLREWRRVARYLPGVAADDSASSGLHDLRAIDPPSPQQRPNDAGGLVGERHGYNLERLLR